MADLLDQRSPSHDATKRVRLLAVAGIAAAAPLAILRLVPGAILDTAQILQHDDRGHAVYALVLCALLAVIAMLPWAGLVVWLRHDATRRVRPLLVAGLAGVTGAAPFAIPQLVWDMDLGPRTFLAVVVGSTCTWIVACQEDRPRALRRTAAWFTVPGAILLSAEVAYVLAGGGPGLEPSDVKLATYALAGYVLVAVTATVLWVGLVLWLASWLVGTAADLAGPR